MKKSRRAKRLLYIGFSLVIILGIASYSYFKSNRHDEYASIQKPLEDKSAIKNGVVVNDEKDKEDIKVKKFEKITKNKKEKTKNHKYPYYTLGDIGDAKYRMPKVIDPMPPTGMTVDNIDETPDGINRNVVNVPFNKYVIFYTQHQDDEVLWAGSAIRYAVRTRGADHVFIALVSSGTGHKVFKEEEFKGMTLKEKAEYRNREFLDSCKHLGIPRKNIFFLYKQRDDWKTDFNLEREFALKMESKYKSVTHITHSYKYDDHFMHRANGETLYKLWVNGDIKDLRFYIKPFLLEYVDASLNNLNVYSVYNKEDYDRIRNACRAYKYINPAMYRAGIGYKTDYMSFDKLVYNKDERSFIIIQNNKIKG